MPTREGALWYFEKLHPEERFMLLSSAVLQAVLPSANHPKRSVISQRLAKVGADLQRMITRHNLDDVLENTIRVG